MHTRCTPRGIKAANANNLLPLQHSFYSIGSFCQKSEEKRTNQRPTEETDNETRIVRHDKRNKVRGKVAPLIERRFEGWEQLRQKKLETRRETFNSEPSNVKGTLSFPPISLFLSRTAYSSYRNEQSRYARFESRAK